MKRFLRVATGAVALGLLLGVGGVASADVPMHLAHQGRLFDQNGYPAEGVLSVDYALYVTPTGGTALWSEHDAPEASDGYFSSVLGNSTTLSPDIFTGEPVYLSVTVNGEELLPRTQLVSVPYAMVANDVVGDIHPRSVSVGGREVIDEHGKWVGDTSGLVGPAGPQGAAGAAGAAGAEGPVGPVGAQGPVGAEGPVGPAGADGATGAEGPQGPAGPRGERGLACWDADENGTCDLQAEDLDHSGSCDVADCVGAVGAVGPAGPTGPVGPMGPVGPQGSVGPAGEIGATGPMGPQGPAGLVGATGPVGPAGEIGPMGPAGPAGEVGAIGPMGPAGPAGLVGATGPVGPMGPAGPAGAIGMIGPMGPAGPAGAIGMIGPMGPAGPAGEVGATGPAGPMGPAGPTGPAGATGPAGPAGSGGALELRDANNVVLGKVLSVGMMLDGVGYSPVHYAFVTIKTSTGHIASVGLDGLLVTGQMYWFGGSCGSGSPLLNSGSSTASRKAFCKLVFRSTTGKIFTNESASCDANGLVDSVKLGAATNIESNGSCSSSAAAMYGWPMTETTNTAIGLPATIALPLSY